MNQVDVTVKGRVGTAPKLRERQSSSAMVTLRVATTPRRREQTGVWSDRETLWFSVLAFGELAENAARTLRVGDPVLIHGRLELKTTVTDVKDFCSHEIVADAIGLELAHGTASYTPVARRRRDQRQGVAGAADGDVGPLALTAGGLPTGPAGSDAVAATA